MIQRLRFAAIADGADGDVFERGVQAPMRRCRGGDGDAEDELAAGQR